MTQFDANGPATFTCTMCGRTYSKAWSDAEALAESKALFGDVPCAVVCDDCYRGVVPVDTPVPDELVTLRARVAAFEAAAAIVVAELSRVGGADWQRLNAALRIMGGTPGACAVCRHGQTEHMHLDGSCAVWQCACAGFVKGIHSGL